MATVQILGLLEKATSQTMALRSPLRCKPLFLKVLRYVQCNHLSHFLLTNLLRDKLAEAGNARVINVSSFAAWHGKINLNNINYESDSSPAALQRNYHNSKLMNVVFSQEISRRWADLGITAYSNHPGLVRYNFTCHLAVSVDKSPTGPKCSVTSPRQSRT